MPLGLSGNHNEGDDGSNEDANLSRNNLEAGVNRYLMFRRFEDSYRRSRAPDDRDSKVELGQHEPTGIILVQLSDISLYASAGCFVYRSYGSETTS